jgi:hypothetical protein
MTQDEKRLDAVMNLLANATTILTASMSSALGNAVGGAFAGMGEAMGAAFGDGGTAHARGDEIRKEVSREVDTKTRDLVIQAQREVRQGMGEAVASLTPAQQKDLLKEIRNEVYVQAVEAANRADLGLPPLTGDLSVDDLLKYLTVQDPRLGELVQKILALPQPKAFAQLQEAEHKKMEKKEAKEKAKKASAVKPLPARITKLPATFRFPPGAKVRSRSRARNRSGSSGTRSWARRIAARTTGSGSKAAAAAPRPRAAAPSSTPKRGGSPGRSRTRRTSPSSSRSSPSPIPGRRSALTPGDRRL